MSQIIPIYIPTYISSQTYAPARVLPRLFYYNGLVDCETWYLESGSLNEAGYTYEQTSFPYFDNYGVVTGSFPTAGSPSLLFNNETPSYGELPTGSLFTQYWDTYISLLYNPRTRLLNCSAIIPLADYVKMELNDIVNFRGNYYHLRAINNYSLKTGDCELQLLGPIIPDTFSRLQPSPEPPAPPPSGAFAEVSWSFTETNGANGNFKIYDNGSPVVTATSTTSGNLRVSQSHAINPEMYPVSWTAGTSMSLNVNGGATISTSATTDTTLTASFTAQTGSVYYVTGSIIFNSAGGCCTPTITSITVSGGNTIDVSFTTGSGCDACSYTTIQSSTDNVNWGGNNTGGCTSPRTITAPTSSTYYRIQVGCASTTSSYSSGVLFTSSSSATLYWSFSEVAGGQGIYDLYVNSVSVETRNSTASGTYTVNVGDVISVGCNADQCTGGGSTYTNIIVSGEITDAACQNNGSIPSYVSPGYTVVSGDVGTNLYLDLQVQCDGGCL